MKRKRYFRKFQRMAVERMRTCENVAELARELEIAANKLSGPGDPGQKLGHITLHVIR